MTKTVHLAARKAAHGAAGFSLVETLVALAILSWVLLLTLSILIQEPQVLRRLDAHGEALGVLETVHESIRGGMRLSLENSAVDLQQAGVDLGALEVAQDLEVAAQVERLSPSGLYRVTLLARYHAGQLPYEQTLQTLIWRP